MTRLSWRDVTARRMQRHGLIDPLAGGPASAAQAMLGAHAQIMAAAEVSIAIRCAGLTRSDVKRALTEDRSLVKTFGPRGTVHLLPTSDLPKWTGALSAVPSLTQPPVQLRFTGTQADEVIAAIADELADKELTIDELNDRLTHSVGSWATERVMPAFQEMWPRWRILVSAAANRGALVFGAGSGRQITYTSPRRLIPGFEPQPAASAMEWLLHSYLRQYGPSTPRDFAQWLSAPRPWAEQLFRTVAGLEEIEVDGSRVFQLTGDGAVAAEVSGIRLLPYFDAYGIGSHPREYVFPGKARQRALARGQAGPFPVLLVDGVVGGVWHSKRSGRNAQITVEPFSRLTRTQVRQLEQESNKVAAVLEAQPTLTIGEVTAGPHA
ncbi:winged helix DNA-binding domain-containing protein [Diaminobutyricimonas sp. TR449]|uniref:winged helix DNA-binding domain-containing protein n=1 Tax=Diaminobutyricimonas sp. TR449 TaxID=2708076 RepID=UPI0014220235|nr:winged helix DNA-binding domain-containing protein [Diaminobutyricimonas sp. TR449]